MKCQKSCRVPFVEAYTVFVKCFYFCFKDHMIFFIFVRQYTDGSLHKVHKMNISDIKHFLGKVIYRNFTNMGRF